MDVDVLDNVNQKMDAVFPGLLDFLLNQTFCAEKKYVEMLGDGDEEFDKNDVDNWHPESFKFMVVTHSRHPNEKLLEKCHALRVVLDEDDL